VKGNPRVRRLAVSATILVVLLVLLAASSGRERGAEVVVPPVPQAPASVVTARLPEDGPTVRAREGTVVRLVVEHDTIDEVRIDDLGLRAPVDRDLPAVLEFPADVAGRHEVVLRDAGRRVGTVVVQAGGV